MKVLVPVFLLCSVVAFAQQIADSTFSPTIKKPEYAAGKGPVVTLDEAHANFHTFNGRYKAFGDLLTRDGYRVVAGKEKFTAGSLKNTKILAIANALAENDDWKLPTRSAFTDEEVAAVKKWVENGGRLLLIADHMPMAGAAATLASAFGFTFYNGFAMKSGIELFYRANGNLLAKSITNGRSASEKVDTIRIFTGQGFKVPVGATVFTALDTAYIMLLPEEAWDFDESTERMSCDGLSRSLLESWQGSCCHDC